jgi:AraC family transcriptional regulator
MTTGLIFSLLNADKVNLNKSWNYKNVISPFYRLYLIDHGAGTLSHPEQSMTREKGFLYLIANTISILLKIRRTVALCFRIAGN